MSHPSFLPLFAPTVPTRPAPAALPPGTREEVKTRLASPDVRLRSMVSRHYNAVWRAVRFFGIPEACAEDSAQQVFCVAARKLGEIQPGAELAFLLSTAWRVASEGRRNARRRPVAAEGDVDRLEADTPSPEQLVHQKEAREQLATILAAMPEQLRRVFVLYELDDLTLPEIAAATGVPLGTASSRLRRGREVFQELVKRSNARGDRSADGGRK